MPEDATPSCAENRRGLPCVAGYGVDAVSRFVTRWKAQRDMECCASAEAALAAAEAGFQAGAAADDAAEAIREKRLQARV